MMASLDRLTSLPDGLLARILSMLPIKEAAATRLLSKSMRRPLCWIELDDSRISHCVNYPHLVDRSSLFESFVNHVLHKLSQSQRPLTRFRLHLGGDKTTSLCSYLDSHTYRPTCFPNPAPERLYTWISYPLSHCGLRELDLSFHVRNPAECKLPRGLFACRSLEVLTLDSNLEINSTTGIPPVCLPNLKILNLHSFVVNESDFVTSLVSNCPALEDLSITYCFWEKADRLTICSDSLQRFSFVVFRVEEDKCIDLELIDTPNLQYFRYSDNLPIKYIVNVNELVEARIYVPCPETNFEAAFLNQLRLARALTNFQHLSMLGWFAKGFYYAAKLKEPLPLFRNLKTLNLGSLCTSHCSARWDAVLLLICNRMPLLEELVFVEGFFGCDSDTCSLHDPNSSEAAALGAASWVFAITTPSCCESHLKRIRIYSCRGRDQELNMIRLLLGKTFVLEELVISMLEGPGGILFDAPKLHQFTNTLEEIPRASNSCSIIYTYDEPDYNITGVILNLVAESF